MFCCFGQLFGVFFVVCLFYLTATGCTIVLGFLKSQHFWEISTYATFCELSKQHKTKPQNDLEKKPLRIPMHNNKEGRKIDILFLHMGFSTSWKLNNKTHLQTSKLLIRESFGLHSSSPAAEPDILTQALRQGLLSHAGNWFIHFIFTLPKARWMIFFSSIFWSPILHHYLRKEKK